MHIFKINGKPHTLYTRKDEKFTPMRTEKAPIKERRGIQSIEVGGQLLLALAENGRPMSLGDLAKAARMPSGKAHPYLVS